MKGFATGCLAIIVLLSFPLWIGIIAGGFGVVIGIFGAIFGAIAGVFGAIFGIIGALLDAIFGGIFNWNWHGPDFHVRHFHFNGFVVAAIIITLAIVFGRKSGK